MLIHDVSDTAVSIFKLCIDVTSTKIQAASYLAMIVSWIYLRLWFFPFHLIKNYVEEAYSAPHYMYVSIPNLNRSQIFKHLHYTILVPVFPADTAYLLVLPDAQGSS